tara:strand:- start:89 stop:946 length:858 start_codon:yes stop_codon:yes gene_type:complete
MIILNGKEYSRELINSYKNKVEILKSKKIIPSICVILVGNNYESELYVKMKKSECEQIGIKFTLFKYNETDNEEDIINKINECNNNIYVHGILVQLPLPKHMSNENIINTIDPKKDIDGLTSYNSGALVHGISTYAPCTPVGCIELLNKYDIHVNGMNVTIIGTSKLVGIPLSQLLLNLGCTITLCNLNTIDIKKHTIGADMVICCCGVSNMVKGDWIKNDVIIIDIGINKKEGSNKITGDVDFNSVKDKVSYITPVPGGIGPMTIAVLIKHVIKAAEYFTNHKY